MTDFYQELIPGRLYHIFNRGNNRENIFRTPENYRYFLGKYAKYMSPLLDTYAYCLLPNHFHLAVRVKTADELLNVPGLPDLGRLKISTAVSNQFRICFMSYAKAVNKRYGRVGSLFQKNFKRKEVNNREYLRRLILYIHANPQLHRIHHDFREWPHSSLHGLISDAPTQLKRKQVLQLFSGKQELIHAHQYYVDENWFESIAIEDEE